MVEDTRYIVSEIDELIERLCDEGMDLDLVLACMLDGVAHGYSNMDGCEGMHVVFRETADQMEAGEYRWPDRSSRPTLKLIEGGGSKV